MNLNFAENVKRLRKEKGDTQEKLSEILGVSAQSVSRWELGICYPDIEMLPSIANYFGVTVDELLSNDPMSQGKDFKLFKETVDKLSDKTDECINFVSEYCRKYPEADYYVYQLVYAIKRHASGDVKKAEKYMPVLLKSAERLLQTRYRNSAVQIMAALCDESELEKWLDLAPYHNSFSRRYCLEARARARNDWEEENIQRGIDMLESIVIQLDGRYPDRYGARKKTEYQKNILGIIESLGGGNGIPDGWSCFYALKQLVLAACLFAANETEEGWRNFDSAIDKCKYFHSLSGEWFDVGGAVFSGIKVDRRWNYVIDEKGQKRKLFGVVNYSCTDMWAIKMLLTDPKWAWFDPVREDPKYKAALEWVGEIEKKESEE